MRQNKTDDGDGDDDGDGVDDGDGGDDGDGNGDDDSCESFGVSLGANKGDNTNR